MLNLQIDSISSSLIILLIDIIIILTIFDKDLLRIEMVETY